MAARKPSPAENEKKATAKPKGKVSPKKPAQRAKAPKANASTPKKPAASQWRAVAPEPEKAPEPGRAVMVIPQPEPPPPKTPWDEFKAALPDSLSNFMAHIAGGGHMAGWCGGFGIPYTNMLRFVTGDPVRAELYARAREDRADVLADEIVAISDEAEIQLKETMPGITMAVYDSTAVQRNKLRVDARKWVAAKLRPRVYGDKLELGGTISHRSLTDEQLLKSLADLGVSLGAITPAQATDGGGDA